MEKFPPPPPPDNVLIAYILFRYIVLVGRNHLRFAYHDIRDAVQGFLWVIAETVFSAFQNFAITRNVFIVKMCQISATNPQIHPRFRKILIRNNTHAMYHQVDIDEDELQYILTKYDISIDNDRRNLSAGITGIVFRGTFNATNKPVIIKLRRRDIHAKMVHGEKQLLNIRFWLRKMAKIESFATRNTFFAKICNILDNGLLVCPQLIEQCDYTQELIATREITETLKEMTKYDSLNASRIKTPIVFNDDDDIDGTSFILLECLTGKSIMDTDKNDKLVITEILTSYLWFTLTVAKVGQGDPHIGNMLYENGILKIFDFGMNVRFPSQKIRNDLVASLMYAIRGDNVNAIESSVAYTVPNMKLSPKYNENVGKLGDIICVIMKNILNGISTERELAMISLHIYTLLGEWYLFDASYNKMMTTASIFSGTLRTLTPDPKSIIDMHKQMGILYMTGGEEEDEDEDEDEAEEEEVENESDDS